MFATADPRNTVTTWIEDLHIAGVWGWPTQAFLTLTGVAIVSLSVTGVLIGSRTRQARA